MSERVCGTCKHASRLRTGPANLRDCHGRRGAVYLVDAADSCWWRPSRWQPIGGRKEREE